jgi:hypothetical protein
MNTRPIAKAHDADLRLSPIAMERAARRAHELAARTGTDIIVSRNGVIERILPQQASATEHVQENPAPYGE